MNVRSWDFWRLGLRQTCCMESFCFFVFFLGGGVILPSGGVAHPSDFSSEERLWSRSITQEEHQPASQEGLQQSKRLVCLLRKLQVTIPGDGTATKQQRRSWKMRHYQGDAATHFKTSPHLLQLFRKILQCCFAVKLQKCFVSET